MEIISVANLKKEFDGLGVLKGISFTLNKGEVLSIIGPSGSGKSTLLRCLTQLEPIDGGKIEVCSKTMVSTNDEGKVVYAGSGLRGYGNLVIIKHEGNYLTAYAHNSKILVKEGESVKRGQRIADMGDSDADTAMLHFEVRRQGKPVDPMKFLTQRGT